VLPAQSHAQGGASFAVEVAPTLDGPVPVSSVISFNVSITNTGTGPSTGVDDFTACITDAQNLFVETVSAAQTTTDFSTFQSGGDTCWTPDPIGPGQTPGYLVNALVLADGQPGTYEFTVGAYSGGGPASGQELASGSANWSIGEPLPVSFAEQGSVPLEGNSQPQSLTVGGFGGAGSDTDIATANGDDSVSLLLGNGGGSFETGNNGEPIQLPSNSLTSAIGSGLLDGDQNEDVAVLERNGGVQVLWNGGSGNFTLSDVFKLGASATFGPDNVAIGDVTGEGLNDIAVGASNPSVVSVIANNGDQSFDSPQLLGLDKGTDATAVAIGQIDAVGPMDIAFSTVGNADFFGTTESPGVGVILSQLSGGFAPTQFYIWASGGIDPGTQTSVALGNNFQGGLFGLNVLGVGSWSDGGLGMLLNNGNGDFSTEDFFDVTDYVNANGFYLWNPWAMVVDDLNQDGYDDALVVAPACPGNAAPPYGCESGNLFYVVDGEPGAPTFSYSVPVSLTPTDVAIGDFGGSDLPDIAVTASGTVNGDEQSLVYLAQNTSDTPAPCAQQAAGTTALPGHHRTDGTYDPNVIATGPGRDRVFGRADGDALCAGPGPDRALGQRGADTVLGQRGADELEGARGDDRLSGGPGDDRLGGGGGDDVLNGGLGFDRCDGGGGDDRFRNCELVKGNRK
jgi:hypothetical protein